MADKRISQLVDRGTVANNDVVPIVVSGAVTTNKATISSIQTFMQGNLDLGVTSVGITFGTSGTDINASGSPVTSSGNITINLPTASAINRGALSSADWITFNAKQPAGNYVTLDTVQTITAQKTFTTSGSSDTMIISHGSGSGFALDVIKAGNGEAIRVQKTSGSGNAMTISGGNFEAPTIVKTGGTSTQYLMANGSTSTLTNPVTGTGASGQVAFWNGTSSQTGDNGLFWDNTNKRLGVGTTAPLANIDVRGADAKLYIGGTVGSSGSLFLLEAITTLVGYEIKYDGANDKLFFNSYVSGVPTTQLTLLRNNGYMGLGTGSPNQIFEISSSSPYIRLTNSTSISPWLGNENFAGIEFHSLDGTAGTNKTVAKIEVYNTSTGNFPNGNIGFFTNSDFANLTQKMTILNTGNVVIQNGGTFTDAGFRLDVNGTARVQGAATITGATSITRAAGETALTASFGGANSSIVLQSHSTSDFSRIQIGTAFALSREGGGVSNINSTASALRLTSNITEFSGTNVLIRIIGPNTSFSAWNSAASTITFGNGYNTYEYIQQTRARHLVWHQTDTSTNPTIFASALFSLSSTTRGFLPPRMTTTQKNAIASPATGLIVYQTDGVEGLYVRTSTAWRAITML
jgi:hypothetical protein